MRRGKLGILYEASLIVGTRPDREDCREDKRRSKSWFQLHDASSPKFACSSFKDVQGLLSEDESNCSNNKSSGGGDITLDSPTHLSGSPPFCHRVRIANFLLRTLSLPPVAESKPYRDEFPAPLGLAGGCGV
ncbi:Glutaredoxin domain-containing protein [Forsythia ovata]|uniref:Glutaredoxin domain-containing protein n=1 Tax=Forsythia ovata TaxID=205694 RepID=A0ABD1WG85_9LAMI